MGTSLIQNAMIMAAGLGTRMRPFSDRLPKPFLPLMGVPMIQHLLEQLSFYQIKNLSANYHHHPELTREAWGLLRKKGFQVSLSDESQTLLGSGGGIKNMSRFFSSAFLVCNADSFCEVDLERLALKHRELKAREGIWATLLIKKNPHASSYREIFYSSESGLLQGFGEKKMGASFFTGISILEPEAVQHLKFDQTSDYVNDLITPLLKEKKVAVCETEAHWGDLGSPECLWKAHFDLIERMETGHLPSYTRKVIESTNRRFSEKVWVSHRTKKNLRLLDGVSYPCYLDWPESTSCFEPSFKLGPHLVSYGKPRVLKSALQVKETLQEF